MATWNLNDSFPVTIGQTFDAPPPEWTNQFWGPFGSFNFPIPPATITGTLASASDGEASALVGSLNFSGAASTASAGESSAAVGSLSFNGSIASASSGEASSLAGSLVFQGSSSTASAGEASALAGSLSFAGPMSTQSAGENSALVGSLSFIGPAQTTSSGLNSAGAGDAFPPIAPITGQMSTASAGENSLASGTGGTPAIIPPAVDSSSASGGRLGGWQLRIPKPAIFLRQVVYGDIESESAGISSLGRGTVEPPPPSETPPEPQKRPRRPDRRKIRVITRSSPDPMSIFAGLDEIEAEAEAKRIAALEAEEVEVLMSLLLL